MRRAGAALAAACCLAQAPSAAARAAPAPPRRPDTVTIVAPACAHAPLDVAAFAAILRVELRAFPYEVAVAADGPADGARRAAGPQVTIETAPCAEATTSVEAIVDGAPDGRRVRRAVDLGDVEPAGRPRVLALAVAELLRQRAEAATSAAPPAAAPSPAPPPPPAGDAAASAARPPPLGLRLAAEARVYSRFSTPLYGGRLGAGRRARRLPIALALDVLFLTGRSQLELGAADLRAIAASVALDWVPLSGAAALAVGPRVELGRASVTGRAGAPAVSAGSTAGLLGGAALAGSLALRAGRAFQPFLELEAGLTLAEVVGLAGAVRAAGFSGAWAAARLGARFRF